MDRLSGSMAGPGGAGGGGDLPVVVDAATGVGRARRWLGDPLPLLLAVGAAGLVLGVLPGPVDGTAAWLVPALFGVVVAGLALSGST